jgi:membrane protease YdiL (CAAX protease family)
VHQESINLENNLDNETEVLQWNTIDVVIISAAIILFFIGAALGTQLLLGLDEPADITLLASIGLAVLEGVVLVFSVYFFGIRRRGFSMHALGLNAPDPRWTVISAVIGMIAIPLSAIVAILVQLALGRPIENTQLPFLAPEGFSWIGGLMMFLLAGLVVPFAEELYFRGVLYNWMRDRWGIWPAILISSLVFGIVHGEIAIAVSAFILGILIAWAYERSSSLWTAIFIHAINNGVKILMLYIFLGLGLAV